jgi:peptide deformylase
MRPHDLELDPEHVLHKDILQAAVGEQESVLRQKSAPVNLQDPEEVRATKDLIQRMIDVTKAAKGRQPDSFGKGIGLSAIQLGVRKRVCMVHFSRSTLLNFDSESLSMINPKILRTSAQESVDYEGCLSFFNYRGQVPRPQWVELAYYDEDLQYIQTRFSGFQARLILHEIDHMDGVLYYDRMRPEDKLLTVNHQRVHKAQDLAKGAMKRIASSIRVGQTGQDIAYIAQEVLTQKGISDFWYYGLPAVVQVGSETQSFVSGSFYHPGSEVKAQEGDLVTVGLSPMVDGYWGDYARSIIIEDGQGSLMPQKPSAQMQAGLEAEAKLHQYLVEIAKPEMIFADLVGLMDQKVQALGFDNVGFMGNWGRNIPGTFGHEVPDNDSRVRLNHDNKAKLNSVQYFTFKPHIMKTEGGTRRFKQEDIYYFAKSGQLERV